MKKIFLALVITVLSVTGCNAETTNTEIIGEFTTVIMSIGNPAMTVNGMEMEIDEGYGTAPVIKNGHTMVPIRTIVEETGGRVEWNNDTQAVVIYRGNDSIELKINSEIAYLNGEEYVIETPPEIINSRTFLPVRFISEGLGFDVDWNEALQQITITADSVNDGTGTSGNTVREDNMTDINVKAGNVEFSAKLYDNETTRGLIKKFPVTYNMSELHGNEKYYYMPYSMPKNSETPSVINKGEIMLYGEDCLVIFYDTFSNSYSYTRLGYIENTEGLEAALGKGGVDVTFELAQ
ncbi:MAG: cyclophilin-like fold protein [Clostridia bacterium]|nr:cyclophilin-like fold protein [Clostridia bacterium]